MKTNTKHTIGKFEVCQEGQNLFVQTETGFPIAMMSQNGSAEGNANLFASAPALLEALKNSLNVLAGLATGDLKQITKDSPAIAQARAAIAQAEGRGV